MACISRHINYYSDLGDYYSDIIIYDYMSISWLYAYRIILYICIYLDYMHIWLYDYMPIYIYRIYSAVDTMHRVSRYLGNTACPHWPFDIGWLRRFHPESSQRRSRSSSARRVKGQRLNVKVKRGIYALAIKTEGEQRFQRVKRYMCCYAIMGWGHWGRHMGHKEGVIGRHRAQITPFLRNKSDKTFIHLSHLGR